MKSLKAIRYLRVSSEHQVEGTSLGAQYDVTTKKGEELGVEFVGTFEDAGVSGGLLESRSGLQAALRMIDSKEANVLIVAKLDRYSRDREHQETIRKRVERAGARIIFCDIDIDTTTPAGRMAMSTMGNFAAFERESIRDRCWTGKKNTALQGVAPHRMSHYGARIVTGDDVTRGLYPPDMFGKYVLIPEHAEVAQTIFEKFASGDTLRSICKHLNREGIPTPRGAMVWRPATLLGMLKNTAYKGEVIWGKNARQTDESRIAEGLSSVYTTDTEEENWIIIPVPPIVSPELWERCQLILEENKEKLRGRPTQRHLLSGILYCPSCGRKMFGRIQGRRVNGKKSVRYECGMRSQKVSETYVACPTASKEYTGKKTFTGWILDELTIRAVLEASRHPDRIQEAITAYKGARGGDEDEKELKTLREKLAGLQKKADTITELQIEARINGIPAGIYEEKLKSVSVEMTSTDSRLKTLESLLAFKDFSTLEDEAQQLNEVLKSVEEVLTDELDITVDEKNRLLCRVIKSVTPTLEGAEVEVLLRPLKGPSNVHSILINCTFETTSFTLR